MGFDGAAFVDRFNTVWNGHDVDGILAMMTEDVVCEASFGKDPWGMRVVGKAAVRELLQGMFARIPDVLALRDGRIAAKRSFRKGVI
jgi:ketosteroid isomerase-like protein